MACQFDTELCSPRFGYPVKGNAGRGTYAPIAIILHKLPFTTSLAEFQLGGTYNPVNGAQSVHYLIDGSGTIVNLVNPDNVAWGLRNLQTSISQAISLFTAPVVDLQAIHIGYEETSSFSKLAGLICCLASLYNIDYANVFTIAQLDFWQYTQDCDLELPLLLAEALEDCSGIDILPDPPASVVPQCCIDNSELIASLSATISALEVRVDTLEDTVSNLQDTSAAVDSLTTLVNSLQDIIALQQVKLNVINDSFLNIIQKVNAHQACIDKMCPAPICIDPHYVCSAMQPNINNAIPLTFCTKLSDYTPPIINTAAYSNIIAPRTGNWYITLNLNYAATSSCNGAKILVELVDCNGLRTLLHEETILSSTLTPTIEIAEVITLTGNCATRIEWSSTSAFISNLVYSEIYLTPLP